MLKVTMILSVFTFIFNDFYASAKENRSSSNAKILSAGQTKSIATDKTNDTKINNQQERDAEEAEIDPELHTKENAKDDLKSSISTKHTNHSCNKIATFAHIVEPLMPAVVNIYTVQNSSKNMKLKYERDPFYDSPLFDRFNELFEQFNNPYPDEIYTDRKALSLGSGFIIDPTGLIVTNHHVINNADEIMVKLADNSELNAKLIGSDAKTDLALLKVEPKNALPYVKFADSDNSSIGDWVIAIGNPFGLGGTVTTGIISSKGRDIKTEHDGIVDDFIQTDAAINSGNSGGPMFNLEGEVVGVNTVILSPSGTNIGIGFAIPANTASNIVNQLKKYGKITRGRLDITIQEITEDIAQTMDLTSSSGALVTSVIPKGAADIAGIKPGDVIIEFANIPVKNLRKLQILVAEANIDAEIPIIIIRDGKRQKLKIKINESADQKSFRGKYRIERQKNGASKDNGFQSKYEEEFVEIEDIVFANLNNFLRNKFRISKDVHGIIVTGMEYKSDAKNLRPGDIIISANNHVINNVTDFHKIHKEAKNANKKILLYIKRGEINLYVVM